MATRPVSKDFLGINGDATTARHPFHLIRESLEAAATAAGLFHLPSPLSQYTFINYGTLLAKENSI
jgi:hypothetical protein